MAGGSTSRLEGARSGTRESAAGGKQNASHKPRGEEDARVQPPGPAPTTRAQVSGHRFLSRRIRHGLVFGDIRMIHDPLARRRRAAIFGVVAAVLAAACAGLMALIDPAPDPGRLLSCAPTQGRCSSEWTGACTRWRTWRLPG
ncbi:hypothetical protein CATYP_02225 [Corynebacterium atypicum]|uniref:Uncharacterized protein n=1 Tax=Corynebacterium atypicum TaxID=191610 RepID=A0ABM5QLP0_9CORY|nr:hypothetical protein CATYP_02225 [Corynebacterium atypicum]